MPKINGREVRKSNVMETKHLAKAKKNAERLAVIDLSPESFQQVAVPIKGMHQVVLVNNAGTHVRTHYGTFPIKKFVRMVEDVLDLSHRPEIKSVFKGRTKQLLSRYPGGMA